MSTFIVGNTIQLTKKAQRVYRDVLKRPKIADTVATIVRVVGDNGIGETLYELDKPLSDPNALGIIAESHLDLLN